MSKKENRQPKKELRIVVRGVRRREVDLRRLGHIGMQFHQARIEAEAQNQQGAEQLAPEFGDE